MPFMGIGHTGFKGPSAYGQKGRSERTGDDDFLEAQARNARIKEMQPQSMAAPVSYPIALQHFLPESSPILKPAPAPAQKVAEEEQEAFA